jgi:excisionase family DNA binding protein
MAGQPLCVEQRYITRKQAAELLSCSDQTVSKMNRDGHLPFYYLGRHAVRIRLADLEAMMRNQNTCAGRE